MMSNHILHIYATVYGTKDDIDPDTEYLWLTMMLLLFAFLSERICRGFWTGQDMDMDMDMDGIPIGTGLGIGTGMGYRYIVYIFHFLLVS